MSATLLGAALLVTRPVIGLKPGDMRVLVLIGVMDTAANGFFAVAATKGLVSVVAVLSLSLSAVMT